MTKNEQLMSNCQSSTYTDTDNLDALRRGLEDAGCSVFAQAEEILRFQLTAMLREASDFENLLAKLNAAGPEYLLTQYAHPNPDERDRQACQGARDRLIRDYREDVTSTAQCVKDAIHNGEIDDLEELDTYIHQTVDGSGRVIYTQQAKEACIYGDSDDAWNEVYSEVPGEDGNIDWSAMAFFVFRADVVDRLGDIVHDEDEFNLFRAHNPEGFRVTWEDLVDRYDEDEISGDWEFEPNTLVHIRYGDSGWEAQVPNKTLLDLDIDDDIALDLFVGHHPLA